MTGVYSVFVNFTSGSNNDYASSSFHVAEWAEAIGSTSSDSGEGTIYGMLKKVNQTTGEINETVAEILGNLTQRFYIDVSFVEYPQFKSNTTFVRIRTKDNLGRPLTLDELNFTLAYQDESIIDNGTLINSSIGYYNYSKTLEKEAKVRVIPALIITIILSMAFWAL